MMAESRFDRRFPGHSKTPTKGTPGKRPRSWCPEHAQLSEESVDRITSYGIR